MHTPKFPDRTVRLYVLASCLIFVSVVILGFSTGILPIRRTVSVDARPVSPVFILDPGHGGEDGGAEGVDGTLEKHLNLDTVLTMEALADFLGYPTVLTRTDDTMLYNRYGAMPESVKKKKSYDLRNRLRFAEESGGSLFCSIHMNKFPQTECRGLQVYYGPAAEASGSYAAVLQNYARTFLDPENDRETKKADASIYLLHRIRMPAVLVECGFLSNPEECALLNTPAYRQKTASVLTAALAEGWEAGLGQKKAEK